MTKNTYVLENVSARGLPPLWLKKFRLPPEQHFTVIILYDGVQRIWKLTN